MTLLADAEGMTAAQFWRTWVANSMEVVGLRVFDLFRPLPAAERVRADSQWQDVFDRSNAIRAATGMPFWDAAILTASREHEIDDEFARAVELHAVDPPQRDLRRSEVLSGALEGSSGRVAAIALRSQCPIEGVGDRHIPMLDLRIDPSPRGARVAATVARRLFGDRLAIFESGRSYHVVGLNLVNSGELAEMLVRSLAWCPIVDRSYVAHHLRRGWCSLRVTEGGGYPYVPRCAGVWA